MTETATKTKAQIVVSSLSVTYMKGKENEVRSLDNINLTIYEGEFIIFFGPSGCGKSTLLYSIANLEKFQGSVVVEEKEINKLVKKEKVSYSRDTIGMVFQAYHLIPTLSVIQNVSLPLISSGVAAPERNARSTELLQRFGVATQANKLPNELSGGQQQRVAICRAVVNNPKIILADEPLGNLDSKSADEVIKLFKDINIRLKKTIILVTHDPTYLYIAHRVFFIKDGKLMDTKVNRDIKDVLKDDEVVDTASQHKVFNFTSKHEPEVKPKEPEPEVKPVKLEPKDSSYLIRSYQARNIATLALTGFSSNDLDTFEKKVESGLVRNDGFAEVMRFLDSDPSQGGLGLEKRTSLKITKHLAHLAREYNVVSNDFKNPELLSAAPNIKDDEDEAVALRRSLFAELDIKLKHFQSLGIIDYTILRRLRGEIDGKELYRLLNDALELGGAALDERLVNKLVKRLEIWQIGHKK